MEEPLAIVCQGPACAARGASALVASLRDALQAGTSARHRSLQLRTSGCRGRCDDALVVDVFPRRVTLTRLRATPHGVSQVLRAAEQSRPPGQRDAPPGPGPHQRPGIRPPRWLWRC